MRWPPLDYRRLEVEEMAALLSDGDLRAVAARVGRYLSDAKAFQTDLLERIAVARAARMACPQAFLPDDGVPYRVLMWTIHERAA